jgi:hypothetical protein
MRRLPWPREKDARISQVCPSLAALEETGEIARPNEEDAGDLRVDEFRQGEISTSSGRHGG